mmetsp:Transcript_34965/g.31511  ORF Transcript_34965/g.31511 Transcript_34965/m.31511 type:complete len:152 (+) Transcript_34965:45-500(+)
MKSQIILLIAIFLIANPLAALKTHSLLKKNTQHAKVQYEEEEEDIIVDEPAPIVDLYYSKNITLNEVDKYCLLNLENGKFLSVQEHALNVSNHCGLDEELWVAMEHPSNPDYMTLRSVSTPNRAVDVWTGYSINHHSLETHGTILDIEQDD